ncbi:protein-disulfide reductase DsbD domain-containing protein [Aestuariibius sp. HNIBRBA575]|uniref:protein-disulfide reductase DsbD domain-containing protein n=1 Tax=Aestuariibius sp. HNIBRBA575 TaxID=3233343 RepID=UPI0034A2B235
MIKWILPPVFAAVAGMACAQQTSDIATAELLPGWRMENGNHMAGLRVRLSPGWKTYWRSPGDAGIPPHFTWEGSQNISSVVFHWPVPDVFYQNGMRSIGYESEVVIPMEFQADGSGIAQLSGQVEIGVCQDVCVPMQLQFSGELSPQGTRDLAIVTALVDRPQSATEANVTQVDCQVELTSDGMHLSAQINMPDAGTNPGEEEMVIETGDRAIWVSEPETHRQGDVLMATADLMRVDGGALVLDRSALRFTVLGTERSVDIMGCTG